MWRRISAALSLFLLSPLIAEYLLGSLPMSMIAILPLMAMMYGSGAILIRESVRRAGRGWPSIILLATAYGLLEEGFVTQSLFNPNYLHLRLLDFGFIPAPGTALPWLIFVVSIHVAWSISVPIALTETLFKNQRETPWLGPIGFGIFALLLVLGGTLVAVFSYKQVPFLATPAQFAATGAAILVLVIAAFAWPRRQALAEPRPAPHPVVLFLAALAAGSAVMLVQHVAAPKAHWSWQACVAAVILLEAAFVAFMIMFTRGKAWSDIQRFALMAGGLFVYIWVGFGTDISLHGAADLPAHAVIAGLFVLLCAWAGFVALRPAKVCLVNP